MCQKGRASLDLPWNSLLCLASVVSLIPIQIQGTWHGTLRSYGVHSCTVNETLVPGWPVGTFFSMNPHCIVRSERHRMDKTDGGWESTGWIGSAERLRHLMIHRLQGRDKEIRTCDSVHVRRLRPEDMNSTRCSPKAWHPECGCPRPEEDRHTLYHFVQFRPSTYWRS